MLNDSDVVQGFTMNAVDGLVDKACHARSAWAPAGGEKQPQGVADSPRRPYALKLSEPLGLGACVLVCHCRVVTDGDILEAVAAGARDEFDIAEACGAGTGCGGCIPAVTALLAAEGCAPGFPVVGTLRPYAGVVGAGDAQEPRAPGATRSRR